MIMPVSDMHDQFLHWYDKQSNFSAPEVTPEEVDIYLNNAQYQFLKILVGAGLEKSQEWIDYTKNITVSYSTVPVVSNNKPNGWYVTLPLGIWNAQPNQMIYRLALLEEAAVSYIDCGVQVTSRIPVVPITRDEYSKAIANPFKKPWKNEILRLAVDNNQFELISFAGSTVTNYYLDYIKEPQRIQHGTTYSPSSPGFGIDQNCEMESKAATKIVELAVELALKTMNDARLNLEQLDKLVKTI